MIIIPALRRWEWDLRDVQGQLGLHNSFCGKNTWKESKGKIFLIRINIQILIHIFIIKINYISFIKNALEG